MSTLLRNARRYDGSVVDLLIDGGAVRWSSAGEAGVSRPDFDKLNHQELDLDGRWIGPGLWDSHVHFGQWTLLSRRLDVSGAGSAAQAAALVGDELARHPLEAEGYLSIGCSPCTSRVMPGEDPRAGRWRGWDKVECGIHTPIDGPSADDPIF